MSGRGWCCHASRTPRPSVARLGRLLRAGDLVVLTGDLGAGKTTLTQGIARRARRARADHLADLRHRPGAPVDSSAARPSCTSTPTASTAPLELDDLDLDASLEDSVDGRRVGSRARRAAQRGPARGRARGDPASEVRTATVPASAAAGRPRPRTPPSPPGREPCCCSRSTPRPRRSPSALHDGTPVVAGRRAARRPRPRRAAGARSCATRWPRPGRAPADVTDVASASAPGRSPGCGSGMVTAPTFAFALGMPVHGVCSLDALAHQALAGSAAAASPRRDRRPAQGGLLGAATPAARPSRDAWRSPARGRPPCRAGADVRGPAGRGSRAGAVPRHLPGGGSTDRSMSTAGWLARVGACAGSPPVSGAGSSRSTCAAPTR